MKEFEKWWNNKGQRINKLAISMQTPGGKSKEELCELAWRAALEWILRFEFDYTLPFNINEYDKIRGELDA